MFPKITLRRNKGRSNWIKIGNAMQSRLITFRFQGGGKCAQMLIETAVVCRMGSIIDELGETPGWPEPELRVKNSMQKHG
jgi:hypothetical protein